jgi:hypothetical protein
VTRLQQRRVEKRFVAGAKQARLNFSLFIKYTLLFSLKNSTFSPGLSGIAIARKKAGNNLDFQPFKK